MLPPLCIYHRHCPDGFAAAGVVRRAFLGDVEFFPASYGEDQRQFLLIQYKFLHEPEYNLHEVIIHIRHQELTHWLQ
jgi:hypothetical protein